MRSEQLDCLFERQGCKWLDENITENKEPDIWKYLTKELTIETIDPDRFAREFDDGFISKQTDQWVSLFYSFLADHDGLWKKGYSWERPGPLRSKHIIRLSDDSHIAPFDEDEKIQVYLPHRNPEINRLFLRTVKATVSSDRKARDFLRALGISEPDEVAIVLRVILPIYKQMATVSEKDNVIHVRSVLRILENCENSRREELLEELKNTPFLFASNASLDQHTYKKPADIYLGGEYTGSRVLEIYFEGNEEAWFLDSRYMDLADDKRMVEKLEQMGCTPRIRVNYTEPDFLNYVWMKDSRMRYKRGVNGFDPYCEIEGLEFALRNINLERSKLIWNLALEHRQRVYGLVQSSNKKNFADCCDMYSLSRIGELLVESQWLPSPNGSSFLKPSDLFLSELPDDFDKDSTQARDLAKKLDFKQEIDEELQEVIAQTPDELKEIAEELMSLPPERRKEATERALEAIKSSAPPPEEPFDPDTALEISVSPTPAELMAEFLESHVQEQPPSTSIENKTWKGPTPEEIERMLKYEEEVMSQLAKSTQVIQKKPMQISDIVTRGIENPILKAFLLEQYDGRCQICDTRLELGAGKHPHIDIFRFIEKRRLVGAWSDLEFSVLGICPNCHALMKHAEGNNVRRPVLDKARQVLNNEAGPEEVSERGGDFYIVSITLAEKERQLYFAPRHMAKISAFIKMLESSQSK